MGQFSQRAKTQNGKRFVVAGVLATSAKSGYSPFRGVPTFRACGGFQRGRVSPFGTRFCVAKSSVLCLPADCHAGSAPPPIGGALPAWQENRPRVSSVSEKSMACFHKAGGHTPLTFAPVFRPSYAFHFQKRAVKPQRGLTVLATTSENRKACQGRRSRSFYP